MTKIAPLHPAEVLIEEFRKPLSVTQHRLAVSIGVPPRRINAASAGSALTQRCASYASSTPPIDLAEPPDSLRSGGRER